MKIKSRFAILDVPGKERRTLSKHFSTRPCMGECPPGLRIPVVIHGYIEGQHSGDDGTSIEFSVAVEIVEVGK